MKHPFVAQFGKNQVCECAVLIFQYLVSVLERAKWRDG